MVPNLKRETAMPDHRIKFVADQVLMHRIRQKALTENRSISDVAKRAVEAGLGPVESIPGGAAIETVKGNGHHKPVVTAAYLSGTLAAAVKQLADETDRSVSHTMRGLIRDALRARGLMPSAATATAAASPTT
jgi:hypothetical protein